MTGFSPRNLKYMRSFAEAWPDSEIVQRALHKFPWGQDIDLLTKLDRPELREWYASKCLEHGRSRPVLDLQIETRLHERQGKAITNFPRAAFHQQISNFQLATFTLSNSRYHLLQSAA